MILLSIVYYVISLVFTIRHFLISETEESYNNLHTVTQMSIMVGFVILCPVIFIYMLCNAMYKQYL